MFFSIAFIVLWLIPSQKLSSLPLYISHSMEMSNAYDRAEQGYTPDETKCVLLLFYALRGAADRPDYPGPSP